MFMVSRVRVAAPMPLSLTRQQGSLSMVVLCFLSLVPSITAPPYIMGRSGDLRLRASSQSFLFTLVRQRCAKVLFRLRRAWYCEGIQCTSLQTVTSGRISSPNTRSSLYVRTILWTELLGPQYCAHTVCDCSVNFSLLHQQGISKVMEG